MAFATSPPPPSTRGRVGIASSGTKPCRPISGPKVPPWGWPKPSTGRHRPPQGLNYAPSGLAQALRAGASPPVGLVGLSLRRLPLEVGRACCSLRCVSGDRSPSRRLPPEVAPTDGFYVVRRTPCCDRQALRDPAVLKKIRVDLQKIPLIPWCLEVTSHVAYINGEITRILQQHAPKRSRARRQHCLCRVPG